MVRSQRRRRWKRNPQDGYEALLMYDGDSDTYVVRYPWVPDRGGLTWLEASELRDRGEPFPFSVVDLWGPGAGPGDVVLTQEGVGSLVEALALGGSGYFASPDARAALERDLGGLLNPEYAELGVLGALKEIVSEIVSNK